ncbi:hypothetical protein QFC21_004067 [Naganishia friedmannii]|uniref:Uncharacterized protein n=1 Tax=Naganishia friedmannii TaxID=89922 RepID=A0ACC2VIS2_9TREE|nr:hypothetical protein QFC21_004067 [Naganishia friedmannii]
MQPTLSQNEENERTETQSDIPQQTPQPSSQHIPITQAPKTVDENGIHQAVDQAHVSVAVNENNKRPRPQSFVVPTPPVPEPTSSSLILGPPISSNPAALPTITPIPPVVIEGSQPKRAMSEEHLSSRSDSPVVNLPNGQTNLGNSGIATGNTKLSEVTYPTEPLESEDVDMKAESFHQPSEEVAPSLIPEVVPTAGTVNKGMRPEDRPSLPEQVQIIRSAIDAVFQLHQKWYIIPSSWWLLLLHLAHPEAYPRLPKEHSTFNKDTDAIPSPTVIKLIDVACYRGNGALSGTTPAPGHKAFWRIKDGLREWQEHDPLAVDAGVKGKTGDDENIGNGGDMTYVEERGWKMIVEWYGDARPPSGIKRETRLIPEDTSLQLELNPPSIIVHQIKPSSSTEPATATTSPTKTELPFRAMFSLNTTLVKLHEGIRKMFIPNDNKFAIAQGNLPPSRLWKLDISPKKLAVAQDSTTTAAGEQASTKAVSTGRLLPSHLVSVLGGDLAHRFEWSGSDDSKSHNKLSDEGVLNGDVFAVEIAQIVDGKPVWSIIVNEDGKAVEKIDPPAPLFSTQPRYTGSGSANNNDSIVTRSKASNETSKRGGVRGLRGLQNLGNTCFMNSGLQCLSNTPELGMYFTSGAYKSEINRSNPLGMKGQVADKFGALIESIWDPNGASEASSSRSFYGYGNSIVPREFKSMIGRFNHSFAGYGQQDTQELIAFLLDGLHEDLNRIYQKPYIEKPDWKDGGGEEELALFAKECWDGYKKRNDSAIVDLFQGQLKSTLICPDCNKKSITLDPFMYLTVPIPQKKTFSRLVYVVPMNPQAQRIRVEVQYTTSTTFLQLKRKVGEILDMPAENLLAIDEFKSNIYQFWLDDHRVADARKDDIVVMHELPTAAVQSQRGIYADMKDTLIIPVYSLRKSSESYQKEPMPFGSPFFITIPKSQASDMNAIWDAVMTRYANTVNHEAEEYLWAPSSRDQLKDMDGQLPADVVENVTGLHIAEGGQTNGSVGPQEPMESLGESFTSTTSRSEQPVRLRQDFCQLLFAAAGQGETDQKSVFFRGTPRRMYTLEQRQQNKRSMLSQVTSAIQKNFSRPGSDDEDDSSPDAILRPGDGIFCVWENKPARHLFDVGLRGRYSTEESYVSVVDPAIKVEEKKYLERKQRGVSLDDCLDEFSKIETLGENDLWYCSNCKKHQPASKQMEIYQLPDILVICMKRFGSSGYYRKIDEFVDFPIDALDMEDRCDERRVAKTLVANGKNLEEYGIDGNLEPLVYDLYAVDNHYGGLGGGHYTATCKNMQDGKWYKFDDSHVSPAGEGDIKSSAAYLLFYRRRTSKPIGGVTKQKIDAEVSNRSTAALPMRRNIEQQRSLTAEKASEFGSDSTVDDDFAVRRNNIPERIDDVDDVSNYDEYDRGLNSLGTEIERDMDDDEGPPAYSLSRPDTPDSGFVEVPITEETIGNTEPAWARGLEAIGGKAGSSWTHVDWTSLGKLAPTANSSHSSSTGDNYVKIDAVETLRPSAPVDDDMVMVTDEQEPLPR